MAYSELPDADAAESDIYERLCFGVCRSDLSFDRLLQDDLRTRSSLHWTPVSVAARAAKWIDERGIATVVDIGSGAGKFCVVAALAGRATYVGLEQRARLVKASRQLAETFDLGIRVRFVHGTLGFSHVPKAEAYYMYNPFGENLFGPQSQIDGDVELSETRYRRDISAAERMLTEVPFGTFLITYNGFGGHVPPTFREVAVDRAQPNVLQMWEKVGHRGSRRARSRDSYIDGLT